MINNPETLKHWLQTIIGKMQKSPSEFVKNPDKDFTRNRKLSFEKVMLTLISMGGGSISKELLDAGSYNAKIPTTSAFVQQRDKILPYAFEYLFREFTQSCSSTKKHKTYRLLAIDGTVLHTPTNSKDADTHYPNVSGKRGYNLMHLNALYDLISRLYVDALVQPHRNLNESKALTDMVDRSPIEDHTILMADRGYESYNNFAHLQRKGWKYLIRAKDIKSSGILSGLTLPQTLEFDVNVNLILTKKKTNETKRHPEVYKILGKNTTFDFLEQENSRYFPMSFRVLRIKLSDDSYETVITNLPVDEFSSKEIKQFYSMRWGIETSFRKLKYAVALAAFHGKKREYTEQEIFAKLIMHNFIEMIITHTTISKAKTKYTYQVNFTLATQFCREFLRLHISPPHLEALISKHVCPIRSCRNFPRKMRPKTLISFLYRIA